MVIAFSLVVALTFSKGLSGLRSVLMPQRRYWPHAIWVVIKLLNLIAFWWWLWAYRYADESYWNIVTFAFVLSLPSIMYLQMDSLLGENPGKTTDWFEHYFAQRVWFFSLNTLLSIQNIVIFTNLLFSGEPNFKGIGWMLIALTYSIVCTMSANRKVHAIVSVVALLGILAFLLSLIEAPTLQ